MRGLWGRECQLEIFEKSKVKELPNKQPIFTYYWDGSKDFIDLDFDITGRLNKKVTSVQTESIFTGQTAIFTLYNVAIEDQLEPGMPVRFKAGYRLWDRLKDMFLGIIVSIPDVEWDVSQRSITIICNNGQTYEEWLGKPVNKTYARTWDAYTLLFEEKENEAYNSIEIAGDISENIAEVGFIPGSLETSDPEDQEYKLSLKALASDLASPGGLSGVKDLISPPSVDPSVSLAELSRQQKVKMSDYLHERWYLKRGYSVAELAEKGFRHVKPTTFDGKPAWECLVYLANKSEAPAPVFHFGAVYWNPIWENKSMHLQAQGGLLKLTNVEGGAVGPGVMPGIERRIEPIREGQRNDDGQGSLGDSQKQKQSDTDLSIPSVLIPDYFPGAVFEIDGELKVVEGFEPEYQRGRIRARVQLREYRSIGRARTNVWNTTAKVRVVQEL